MARARFIRPEFFTDEKMGDLPCEARLLFASIWCQSDLRGVFEYSAKQLRVVTFPFDEGLTSATVQGWLDALEAKGMIGRFQVLDKSWGYVRKWGQYQAISGRETDIDKKMRPEQRRPDPPCSSQVVPGSCPSSALASSPAPAPSPTPATAPAPTPSPSPSPAASVVADAPTPPGGDGGAKRFFSAFDPDEVRQAVDSGDVLAVVGAYGAATRNRKAEWTRDTHGLQIGVVATILHWAMSRRQPIREPSGFRKALIEWNDMTLEAKRLLAGDWKEAVGITTQAEAS